MPRANAFSANQMPVNPDSSAIFANATQSAAGIEPWRRRLIWGNSVIVAPPLIEGFLSDYCTSEDSRASWINRQRRGGESGRSRGSTPNERNEQQSHYRSRRR